MGVLVGHSSGNAVPLAATGVCYSIEEFNVHENHERHEPRIQEFAGSYKALSCDGKTQCRAGAYPQGISFALFVFFVEKGSHSSSVILRAAVVIPSSLSWLQTQPEEAEPMKSREQDPVIQSA